MDFVFRKIWKEMLDEEYRKAVVKKLRPYLYFGLFGEAIVLLNYFMKGGH